MPTTFIDGQVLTGAALTAALAVATADAAGVPGPQGVPGPPGPGTAPGLSATLNWAGGVIVLPGTYLFTGAAPYAFTITSLDASAGAGGSLTATVRNAGATAGGLGAVPVTLSTKTSFPASGANLAVSAGAIVDVVLTVTGSPTNAFLTLNGTK